MAEANSLIYLVYSLLALVAKDGPTTDPSLKVWETTSEPSVTDSWHHDSQRYTERSDDRCPSGEEWSNCNANCQKTCENVDEQVVCPQMCVPGCVCSEPGTVRDSHGNCVHPPLCKDTHHVEPVDEVDPDESHRSRVTKRAPVTSSHDWEDYPAYTDGDYTFEPLDEVDPDESHRSRVTKLDPDEVTRATPEPKKRGCPNEKSCFFSCKSRGYKGGKCSGTVCRCTKRSPTRHSAVDPDEIDPYTRFPNDQITYGGCPSSDSCGQECQQKGFMWGVCTGIIQMTCKCFNSPNKPFTDNTGEVEITTDFSRIDPDEIDPVTRDPRSRDKLNSGPCISQSSCNANCKKAGFMKGLCYGPEHNVCQCYNTAPKPYSTEDPDKLAPHTRFPSVDPDEDDHTDEYPRYTFNPDENDRAERDRETDLPSSDDCDDMKCFKDCKSQGRKWGSCIPIGKDKDKKKRKTRCDCSKF